MSEEQIDRWRAQIDSLDTRVLSLLNRRAEIALRLGLGKRKAGLPLHDPRREAQVLASLAAQNSGPLGDDSVRNIFRRIIAESRRLEISETFTSKTHNNGKARNGNHDHQYARTGNRKRD
jgi:chorismate mutase